MHRLIRVQFIPLYLIAGTILISTFAVFNRQAVEPPFTVRDCARVGDTITIRLLKDGFSPRNVEARLCDRVEIVNTSGRTNLIAFGLHENHVDYPGIPEQILKPEQKMDFVLVAAGEFEYHDHFDESRAGKMSVVE